MKKYLTLVLILPCFYGTAHAANFSFSNYLFKSDSKSGLFFGADVNKTSTNYYTNYYNRGYKNAMSPKNKPYENITVVDKYPVITYGFRYYMPSKKAIFNKLGFGFKGWYGKEQNTINRNYYGTGNVDTVFIIKADVTTVGYEGQLYYDLLNFQTKKINHAIGLTLGAGSESKSYHNFSFGDTTQEPFNHFTDFKLSSLVYDVSLYYNFANHFRFEAGYKLTNYKSNAQSYRSTIGSGDFIAESETTPKNNYYYFSTSYQF